MQNSAKSQPNSHNRCKFLINQIILQKPKFRKKPKSADIFTKVPNSFLKKWEKVFSLIIDFESFYLGEEVILRGDSGRIGEPNAIPKVILIPISPFQEFEIRCSVTSLEFPRPSPGRIFGFHFHNLKSLEDLMALGVIIDRKDKLALQVFQDPAECSYLQSAYWHDFFTNWIWIQIFSSQSGNKCAIRVHPCYNGSSSR